MTMEDKFYIAAMFACTLILMNIQTRIIMRDVKKIIDKAIDDGA